MILCDRFFDSSSVYQGYCGGVDRDTINQLINMTCEKCIPDLTFYLDIDPVKAFERKGGQDKGDRFEEKSINFHHKVREGFLDLANKNKDRIVVLDATMPIEEVVKIVKAEISKKL